MNFEILKKYGVKAKKSLWQNFLFDDNILDSISSILDINWKNVLEIWPWFWALTEKLLLKNPNSLHLVELDKDMIEILYDRIKNSELRIKDVDFQIFNKDVLKFEPEFKSPELDAIQGRFPTTREWQIIGNEMYYVIANIPYYITSPILQKFLYNVTVKPEKMIILMQKDVWDKILSWQISQINDNIKKIRNKSSVLSLFIAKKSYVKEILSVPASSFIPAPKVESSVLLFETHNNYSEVDDSKFLELIKIWFREPRKKLINNLVKWWFQKEIILEIFNNLWFHENIRWEDLSIDEWIELYGKI